VFQSIQKAAGQFSEDDCMTLAASLAFYTLFALPPLLFLLALVISIGMASFYELGEANKRAHEFLEGQVSQLIGNRAAAVEVSNMLHSVGRQQGVWWKSAISFLGVLVGATGLMTSLQSSLNRVWRVKPDMNTGFAVHFIFKRVFSLAMILGFGFVLLVSFVVSSLLMVLSTYATKKLGLNGVLPLLMNHTLMFLTGWIFFSVIFKFMPDAKVTLRSALIGGLFTIVLFTIGRVALFFYFQYMEPGEQLGTAAGAVAIILLWVYYSSVILLFGAEFTVANALLHNEPVTPEDGATIYVEQTIDKQTASQIRPA